MNPQPLHYEASGLPMWHYYGPRVQQFDRVGVRTPHKVVISRAEWNRKHLRFARPDFAGHPELPGADLHGPANHEPIPRLENVERTPDAGEADGANEDRDLGAGVGLLDVAGSGANGLGWCRWNAWKKCPPCFNSLLPRAALPRYTLFRLIKYWPADWWSHVPSTDSNQRL